MTILPFASPLSWLWCAPQPLFRTLFPLFWVSLRKCPQSWQLLVLRGFFGWFWSFILSGWQKSRGLSAASLVWAHNSLSRALRGCKGWFSLKKLKYSHNLWRNSAGFPGNKWSCVMWSITWAGLLWCHCKAHQLKSSAKALLEHLTSVTTFWAWEFNNSLILHYFSTLYFSDLSVL